MRSWNNRGLTVERGELDTKATSQEEERPVIYKLTKENWILGTSHHLAKPSEQLWWTLLFPPPFYLFIQFISCPSSMAPSSLLAMLLACLPENLTGLIRDLLLACRNICKIVSLNWSTMPSKPHHAVPGCPVLNPFLRKQCQCKYRIS